MTEVQYPSGGFGKSILRGVQETPSNDTNALEDEHATNFPFPYVILFHESFTVPWVVTLQYTPSREYKTFESPSSTATNLSRPHTVETFALGTVSGTFVFWIHVAPSCEVYVPSTKTFPNAKKVPRSREYVTLATVLLTLVLDHV